MHPQKRGCVATRVQVEKWCQRASLNLRRSGACRTLEGVGNGADPNLPNCLRLLESDTSISVQIQKSLQCGTGRYVLPQTII